MSHEKDIRKKLAAIKHHHTPEWQNSSYFASFTPHWNLYIIYGKLGFLRRQSLHIFDTIEEENSAKNHKTSLSILARIRKSIRGASKKETNLQAQANKYEVMAELIGDTSELSERIFGRVKQHLDDQNVGCVNKHGDNIEKLKKDLEDLENFINQSFPTTLPKALFDVFKGSGTILGMLGIISGGFATIGLALTNSNNSFDIAISNFLVPTGGTVFLVTLALLAIIGAAYWVARNRQEICPALKTADEVDALRNDEVFQRLMKKYPAPMPKETAEQENARGEQQFPSNVISNNYQSPIQTQVPRGSNINENQQTVSPSADSGSGLRYNPHG